MKELLIMAKSLGGGGSEVALIEFINALSSELYNITLVLLDKDEEYAYKLKKPINVIQIAFKNQVSQSMVSMYAFPAKALKKLSINKYVSYYDKILDCVTNEFNEVYDMALDFYGYGSFTTAFVAKKIKAKKKATWIHDENMYWLKSVNKYFLNYDAIFCVSEAVRNTFCRIYPEQSSKATTFYNILDSEDIKKKAQQKTESLFDEKTFNIVTVGRLTAQKGYDIAIKTAKNLADRNVDFMWYIIGEGRDRRKLEMMSRKQGLSNKVVFLGAKKNPYPYMKSANLYVQPSRHEGYGLTVAEARILELPIVASNIPPFKEQIINGINGYIVELGDVALADEIEALYRNPEKMNVVVEYLKNNPLDFTADLKKLEKL